MITKVVLELETRLEDEGEMQDFLDNLLEAPIEDGHVISFEVSDFEYTDDDEVPKADEDDSGWT